MIQLQLSHLTLPGASDNLQPVAGVDEVGRGALFGPVVSAAVILSDWAEADLLNAGLADSKQLTPSQRELLAEQIKTLATDYQIGIASVQEIDRLNILQASLLSMRRAILRLNPQPNFCLIDGNQRIQGLPMPHQTLVKGDQQSAAIAAASILAKVWRDALIVRLAAKYPGYDLATNKGYGTAKHKLGLKHLGACRQHRLSFSPCKATAITQEYTLKMC
jgi:ribonuclease HII